MTTGRTLRFGEAALGGGLVALGVFIAVETARLEVLASYAAIGPKLFPSLIAAGLILVGAAVLREAFFGAVAHAAGGLEIDRRALVLVSAGLILQMLLLDLLGWVLAAALLFAAVARAFGSRRPLLDLGIGLVLSGLAFALFVYGLGLSLPVGSLLEGLAGSEP
jgi:putative tricarboxylic transport membrane protein